MFKQISKWSIYAGVVGLLVFGAVIRTEAKAEQESSQPEMRFENNSSGSQGQGDNRAARSSNGGEEGALGGQGSGRNNGFSGSGEEVHSAEGEEHDWVSLTGTVTGLDPESLWIDVDQEEPLEITGRAWRFILESGFLVEIGDEVGLEGFFEDGEFEVSCLVDQTSGQSLQIREDSGRPLWSGGAGR